MSRRPAFDPARLDDDFDQLLAPSTAATAFPRTSVDVTIATADEDAAVNSAETESRTRQSGLGARPPRGAAGRPARHNAGTPVTPAIDPAQPLAVAAVRIPKPLYDAVVLDRSARRRSGTTLLCAIVAWTCKDHADDVIEEVRRASARTQRSPRGRKLATEVLALTLRFQVDELAAVDDVRRRAAEDEAISITRTAAVTAALRVAVKYGAATLMVQTPASRPLSTNTPETLSDDAFF